MSILTSWLPLLKPCHRLRAEQFVGLVLIAILCLGWGLWNRWIVQFSIHSEQVHELIKAPWTLLGWISALLWSIFYISQTVSFWTLWRQYPLRALKLEISVYLSQFSLQILWSLSFFLWHETSLALVILLLQLTATLLNVLVFWKKDRLAGLLMSPPLILGIYIGSLNMALCLLN
jgi:translocator protein